MYLTKGVKDVVYPTNLGSTCQFHTALEESFLISICSLIHIQESDRSISIIDGKLASMLHLCFVHAPHMWGSGLILVVTGELEFPVKTLVGSLITCSGKACSVKHTYDRMFTVVDFAISGKQTPGTHAHTVYTCMNTHHNFFIAF